MNGSAIREPHGHCLDELQQEIRMLESRLRIMGLDGDCAYERALSQVYDALLMQKRQQLEAMRVAGF